MENESIMDFDDLTYELNVSKSLLETNTEYLDNISKTENDSSRLWEFDRLQQRMTYLSYILMDKLEKISDGVTQMQTVELKSNQESKGKG